MLADLSGNLMQAQSLHGMGEQGLRSGEELHNVRQRRMKLECRLVGPFRVDGEYRRLLERFEDAKIAAARLRTGRFHHPEQLFAESGLLSRQRLKTDNKVKGQTKNSFFY